MKVAEKTSDYQVVHVSPRQDLFDEFNELIVSSRSIPSIRQLVFSLAIKGKLSMPNSGDHPASELVTLLQDERREFVAEGKARNLNNVPLIDPSEHAFTIPERFKWVQFGDLGDWGAGATPSRSDASYYGGNIPWFKSGELNNGVVMDSEEKITTKAIDACSLRLNCPGDVLIAMYGATIGKLAIAGVECTTNQAVCACTCFSGVFNRYLFLALQALKPHFIKLSAGAAQPNYSKEKIVRTSVPLPPLAEQHRIVAKVDGLMRLCDELEAKQAETAKVTDRSRRSVLASLTGSRDSRELSAAWRRLSDHFEILLDRPESLADLRQTILTLAVQGKLVKQDPNDEPADTLFAEITRSKRALVVADKIKPPKCPRPNVDTPPFGVPPSWIWVKLGAIAHSIESGWSPNCESHPREGEDWGVLKISAVTWGVFQPDENKALPSGVEARPHCEVQSGDFLMSRANTAELVAKSVIVRETPPRLMMNDKLLRIVFSPNISLDYVNLVNNSAPSRTYYESVASGTSVSMRNVSRENVTNLPIPLPPLAEQKRIVAKVDRLLTQCDRVAAQLQARQATTEQLLTASIHRLLAEVN